MKCFSFGVLRSSDRFLPRFHSFQFQTRMEDVPFGRFPLLCLLVSMAIFSGCSGEQDSTATGCQPGVISLCVCSNGAEGTQLCNQNGSAFEACGCEGPAGLPPVERGGPEDGDISEPPTDISEEEDTTPNDIESLFDAAPTPDDSEEPVEPEPVMVEVRVAESNCDAEERADGSMSIISTDLELVEDKEPQRVGVRFRLEVPRDAIILAAFIRFEVDEVSVDPTNLTIHAQLVDDAGDFEPLPQNISVRPLTEASVDWEPSPWETLDESHDTPSLVSLVNEIVTRPGWKEGNDMVFVIQGSGARVAKAQKVTCFVDQHALSVDPIGRTVAIGAPGVIETVHDDIGVLPNDGAGRAHGRIPDGHAQRPGAQPFITGLIPHDIVDAVQK